MSFGLSSVLSPCESPLNDRFVIMRHLRNFYMNSLNDLTFERASIPRRSEPPSSLRCGIVIISGTMVGIKLILQIFQNNLKYLNLKSSLSELAD